MLFKKIMWMCAFTLATSTLSFADITINNNTDYYGTGYTNFTPCSSRLGVIIEPHQIYTIPQSKIDGLCGLFGCEVHIFLTNNCSGNEFATVQVNHSGVTSIDNHDREHFEIVGSGNYFTLNVIKKGWRSWFKFPF